jgi:DsbC/DsbD-like thiol-disulfide interchange protein
MLESLLFHFKSYLPFYRSIGLAFTIILTGMPGTTRAFQQFDSPFDYQQTNHDVRILAISDLSQAKTGESFNLYVRIELEKGWHIYSLEAQEGGENLATTIRTKENLFLGQGKWHEPDPEIILDQALDKVVKTHRGGVEFRRTYLVNAGLKSGIYPINGIIRFRACDNKVCTLPKEIPFSTKMRVVSEKN